MLSANISVIRIHYYQISVSAPKYPYWLGPCLCFTNTQHWGRDLSNGLEGCLKQDFLLLKIHEPLSVIAFSFLNYTAIGIAFDPCSCFTGP